MIKYILLFLSFLLIIGCTKNEISEEIISFGKIEIINRTLAGPDSIITILNDKDLLPSYARQGASNIQILPKKSYNLSFYTASNPDSLLIETDVEIKSNETTKVTLFSIDQNDPVKIVNLPEVAQPAADSVVISLANFATDFLTENIDIVIVQVTKSRRPYRPTDYINIDTISGFGKDVLGNNFTPFYRFPVGKYIDNGADNYVYYLVPIDSISKEKIEGGTPGSIGIVEASAENRIIQGFVYGNEFTRQVGQL